MAALVSSRRREAVDLAVQLSQAQAERRSALAEAEASHRAMQQEQSNMAAKDAIIAKLRALLPAEASAMWKIKLSVQIIEYIERNPRFNQVGKFLRRYRASSECDNVVSKKHFGNSNNYKFETVVRSILMSVT
jgi:hypothetical protein